MILQNPIDPNLPAELPVEDLTNWPDLLDGILVDVFTPASPPLLPLGNGLWAGLAGIVVAWTGLRIAFGGHFNFWDIVRMIIGLAIPLMMLRFYAVPVPGLSLAFPNIIPAGANEIADLIQTDIHAEMNKGLQNLFEAFSQNMAGAVAEENFFKRAYRIVEAGFDNLFYGIASFLASGFFFLLFCGIFAISMAQVFWAQIAISILIFLGPAFIPWLVFEPMKFLFWGWFRAMWTYSLYAIIAAAMMRIWSALSLTMINSMVRDGLAFGDILSGTPSIHAIAVIPLFAAAFLSSMKIPELAGAIGGVSVSGGGMLGFVTGALTAGMSKLAKLPGGK